MSRLIDAEGSELQTQLKIIREAEYQIYGNGSWGFTAKCEHAIDAQPTVNQWIPCSERLPREKDAGILKKLGTQKRSDSVIVTVDVKGERMTDLCCTHDGVWQWKMKYAFPDYKVTAWMPLPEPYKEDTK